MMGKCCFVHPSLLNDGDAPLVMDVMRFVPHHILLRGLSFRRVREAICDGLSKGMVEL